jgi:hypothetical protein
MPIKKVEADSLKISPQEGFQWEFLKTSADIAIGGGGAGVGKTYAEIIESIRHRENKNFSCVFFRRTFPQIAAPGGLMDESKTIYPIVGAKKINYAWHFPSGAKVVFSHLQYEDDVFNWQGSQIPLIIFDELTHFSKRQFFYMLSRNRSTCGVRPYIRATCNPDADSFVRDLIDWWIDEDGYVIPERSGVIRYMTVLNDEIIWGKTKKEVLGKAPHLLQMSENPEDLIKSFTFIEGDIQENRILLKENPEYLGNLMALSEEDQLRLLKRNWNIKIDKTVIINFIKFKDLFSNEHIKGGEKYITADIATTGSDILSIWVWDGKRAIDLVLVQKNNGAQALEFLKQLKNRYAVPASNICFDADGVGGGLTGFIDGAIEFHGGGRVFSMENFKNLRAQCYFNFAYSINQTNRKKDSDNYYISPEIKDRVYPFNKPSIYKGKKIEWILYHQLKAIKQNKPDAEGKLSIIPKEEMKVILQGISPDLLDGLMMRERFVLSNINPEIKLQSKESLGLF